MDILSNYIDKGGIIFFILVIISFLALTIILYKTFEIFFFNRLSLFKFRRLFDESTNLNELKNKINNEPSCLQKSQTVKIIELIKKGKTREEKEENIKFFLIKEIQKAETFLPSLEIVAQVSPLIGLLGTVIGMIDSFNELELGGSLVDPSILAGGIWTALLTTAMGLIVAIPALISHYFFEKKLLTTQNQTESYISRIISLD